MTDHRPDSSAAPDAPYAEPLPREWLPEGVAPEGDALWEARATRILARAEHAWPAEARSSTTRWLPELSGWLSPAAALAAAAATLLLAAGNQAVSRPHEDAAALSLITADGDPVALWATLGVAADPILALLTLEDHTGWTGGADAARPATGERR